MIATAVFSVVLLLCATAILQIGQQFYKGTIINRTQNTARAAIDDIAQTIQFGAKTSPTTIVSGTKTTLCIGQVRYTYTNTQSLGQIAHVLWKDRIGVGGCGTSVPDLTQATPSSGGQELLGSDMRLPSLDVTANGKVWSISLNVAYGPDDDVFAVATAVDGTTSPDYTRCKATRLGGQFCAVSAISTQVVQRL